MNPSSSTSILNKVFSSGVKVRVHPESNYRAIFHDGETLRMPIDPSKPISELHWSEFYDISFGTKCVTGKCPFCYAGATSRGVRYTDLAKKIYKFFGQMTDNQRPTQCAIGGSSEPLEHPECWDAFDAFHDLGIIPNVTTNAVLLTRALVERFKKYQSGLAVTFHPHLEKHWRRGMEILRETAFPAVATHVIISDKASVEYAERLYKEYSQWENVKYFVLLPYKSVGLAANAPKTVDYDALEVWLDKIWHEGKIALGANAYNFMVKNNKKYDLQLYPPEIFSKYLVLDDNLTVYNNSFDCRPVPFSPETGCALGYARTEF